MRAAIYARKSTDQSGVSDEQRSVARQVDHARAYAEAKGWAVAEESIFVDDGISGAEFKTRPGFLRLMNAVGKRPPFDVLIMSEESRLGREAIETGYALKQIVQAGVRVFFYLEDRERTLDSPTDKIMMSLTAFADELEREKARQRTADAMQRKARAGHVTGGAVFGYRNRVVVGADGRRSHVEREVHEEEAAVIRAIFEWCAAGYGVNAIAKRLNAERAPTPRAQCGRPNAWAPSSVRAVLGRELYRGVIVYNRTKKRDSWGVQRQRRRPETDWIRVEAPALRILSEAQWERAQTRLGLTRETYLRTQGGRLWGRPPSGLAAKYLLPGIARCGVCGAGLEVRSRRHGRSGRAFFYSCSSFYRRGPHVCPNRFMIPMPTADASVINAVLSDVLDAELLGAVTEKLIARARAAQATPDEEIASLERRLSEVEAALRRLTAAVAAGGDVPTLVEALKAQEAQRSALRRRLDALQAPAVAFDRALEERLAAAVKEWREVLGRQVVQARQILTKLLDGRLTFEPAAREGRSGFRFYGTGTVAKLIAGIVPGEVLALQASGEARLRAMASPRGAEGSQREGAALQAMASPAGFEPAF